MNVVAWVLQIVLAVAFLAAGGMKVVRPKPVLVSAGMATRRASPTARSRRSV